MIDKLIGPDEIYNHFREGWYEYSSDYSSLETSLRIGELQLLNHILILLMDAFLHKRIPALERERCLTKVKEKIPGLDLIKYQMVKHCPIQVSAHYYVYIRK